MRKEVLNRSHIKVTLVCRASVVRAERKESVRKEENVSAPYVVIAHVLRQAISEKGNFFG
jgi:hypothetical protein